VTLADKFPRNIVAASVERQFEVGTVIKLEAKMDDGKVRQKRFVVAAIAENVLVLVVNSEVSNFIKAQAVLLKAQVNMPVALHAFMDHDSHIDCSRARTFPKQAAIEQLSQNPAWILGKIAKDTRDAIVVAIKAAQTISTKQKEQLCTSLENCDFK
jgi:hypothetical protein